LYTQNLDVGVLLPVKSGINFKQEKVTIGMYRDGSKILKKSIKRKKGVQYLLYADIELPYYCLLVKVPVGNDSK
jgi:hypothetical protein